MAAVAFPRMFARGLPAPPPAPGAPTLVFETGNVTGYYGGENLWLYADFVGDGPLTVGKEALNPATGVWSMWGGWPIVFPADTARGFHSQGNPPVGHPTATLESDTVRYWATADGSDVKTYSNPMKITYYASPPDGGGGVTLPPSLGSFGKPSDYVYPSVPAVGSTTAAGQTVVEVSNAAQLSAAIADNRYIILNDGNYWTGGTWIVSGRKNMTLRARNRHGARFAAAAYGNVNGFHFSLCDDLQLIGLDFAKTGYYSIRFGADNLGYPSSPFGPNRRVKVYGCRFRDLTTGAIKIDNGYGNGSASPYISTDFEIGWCEISKTGQAAPSTNLDFAEGIYMGDGTYPYHQRVDNINIHHCLIDGSEMLNGSGEAIEAKVYVSNLRIADTEIRNWQLADSTSGGALALSINRGTNIAPGVVPDNGAAGYLVERCFIHGTRLRSGTIYAKGAAISLGHGNTVIRNCVLANNVSGGLIFVNNTNTHTGIFSNPSQLDVAVLHCTIVGNGSLGQYGVNWAADPALTPPQYFARVTSRNNLLSGAASYPANQGVTWVAQQDAWGVVAGQLGGSFATDDVALLKPSADSAFVTGTDVGVSADLLGNPRPSGARQFGAIEVQV